MNFFNGKLEDDGFKVDGGAKVAVPEGKMKMLREQGYVGKDLMMGVRPEDIHDEPAFSLKHHLIQELQSKSMFLSF